MDITEDTATKVEYRCALVRPRSRNLLAVAESDQHRLPRIHVPARTRPARELQMAIKARWKLDVLILETWFKAQQGATCVAELLSADQTAPLAEVPVNRFERAEISEDDCRHLESILDGSTTIPFSRLGWIDEAMAWIASATGAAFPAKRNIAQWNAGGGFALFRTCSDTGRHYWLKATSDPNRHEFAITRLLAESYPDFLPRLIACKAEWNAWLTEDAGVALFDLPGAAMIVPAAERMATLQFLTAGHTTALIAAGASDQRLATLRNHIDRVVAYLNEAMARQTSAKATPLGRDRLIELGEILRAACFQLEALHMPDTLIHNDLNPGNILSNRANVVFTDWSEAAVGNPFIACERLCVLNQCQREGIQTVYRRCWSDRLSNQVIDQALALMPLIAIYAYLYGRGDWLRQTKETRPRFESYARSLARLMDRAAGEISLREALCH